MAMQFAHENHYVPIWYQKRFIVGSKTSYFRLDLSPSKIELPNGQIKFKHAVKNQAPSVFFKTNDLYTTQFGQTLSDEIEKRLFGKIDHEGSKAVRAFADNDQSAIHEQFQTFFMYLDAQKLRTPKGLDWIKSKYFSLTQLELMVEMQGLRQMHCTMWSESVREIVSAENSDIKFIVTDHPVTVYNAAFPPTLQSCQYPGDPSIELVGTQTIFALDANHCLILSNLEYAKNSTTVELTAPRTNARYRGKSLVRTDAFIRTRKLTCEEVVSINYLMKARAHKYIAASEKDWLYPERSYSKGWEALGKVLLPRDELWRFGGEIYVGYKDGSSKYQDEFGRTSSAHKYLQKKIRPIPLPNDLCGCGSGRKFKKCCKDVPEENRPSWSVRSIRERNLMFCRAVADILELKNEKTWDDVRKELSNDHVKRIHQAFGSLWPRDTDLADLLPHPDDKVFRALYLGIIDPRTISAFVTSWLLYFDEIVIPNPFLNHTNIKPEYSPTDSPGQYKEQTLKNVFLLLILEPYIDAGLVHFIPDPAEFNDAFRHDAWEMAEERTGDHQFDEKDMGYHKELAKDDFMSAVRRLPDLSLRSYFQRHSPGISDDELALVVAHMKEQHAMDPYSLLQPIAPGKDGAQVRMMKGFNLELAMFLAGFTGSVIYTDLPLHWKHLHTHTKAGNVPSTLWQPLSDRIKDVEFPLECDWQKSLQIRVAGELGDVRKLIRCIGNAVRIDNESSDSKKIVKHLTLELKKAETNIQKKWPASDAMSSPATLFRGHLELSIPAGGFERNTVRRLLITFGRAKQIHSIPMAFFVKVDLSTS